MTRTQFRIVTVVSVLATAGVLLAGSRGHGISAAARAALAKQATVDVGGGAAAGPGTAAAAGGNGDPFQLADASGGDGGGASGAGDAPATVDDTAGIASVADVPQSAGPGDSAGDPGSPAAQPPAATPSKIKHVFVVSLAGQGFDATFGPSSPASYLVKQLVPKGVLLTNYRSLGRADLPDRIALVGGQPPNADTRRGCPSFTEFPQSAAKSASGEISGDGCVFPNTVTTVADQVTSSGQTWRAYVEDQDKGPRGAVPCRRPESNAGTATRPA